MSEVITDGVVRDMAPHLLTRRAPGEVGTWETGCHYHVSNNMALTAETTSHLYETIIKLFEKWNEHLTNYCQTGGVDVIDESLRWLLVNAEPLYYAVVAEIKKCGDPAIISPSETRDWFFWLHRFMKYLKIENNYVRST